MIPGIPRHLIERAAADPRNAHAKDALVRLGRASAPSRTLTPREPENAPQSASKATGKGKRRGEPNKTEMHFAREVLDPLVASGGLARYEFEAITLHIHGVARFTADWIGWEASGRPVFFEVKGWTVHAASLVRVKAHAAARPWLRFVVYKRRDGGWVKHFDSACKRRP